MALPLAGRSSLAPPDQAAAERLMWTALVGLGGVAGALLITFGGYLWVSLAVMLGGIIGVLFRRRSFVLLLASGAVLLGSSVNEAVADSMFYGRFLLYGVLLGSFLSVEGSKHLPRADKLSLHLGLALAGLGLASAAWSVDAPLSAARGLSLLLLFTAIAVVARSWKTESEVRADLSMLVIGVGIVMVVNLFVLLLSPTWAYNYFAGGVRFRGILQNPNAIGVAAALALPLSLGLASSAEEALKKRLWLLLSACIGFFLLLSQSRGGILAALIGLAAYGWQRSRTGRRRLLTVLVVSPIFLVALFTVVPGAKPGVARNIEARFFSPAAKEATGSGRLAAWSLAISTWQERPAAGWGFGTTEEVFGPRAEAEIEQVFNGAHPHNAFLDVLLELGPIGLILLVALLSIVLARGLTGEQDDVRAALTGALIAGCVLFFVESGVTAAGSILAFNLWFIAAGVLRLRSLCASS